VLKLMIEEAQLAIDPKADEAPMLAALLETDKRGPDIDADAYPAAVALGTAALKTSHSANALTAWRAALRHIDGAPGDKTVARAQILIGEGIANVAMEKDEPARLLFVEAITLVTPLASESSDWQHVSIAEMTLAEALAWRAAAHAQAGSEKETDKSEPKTWRWELSGKVKLCPGHVEPVPLPQYPTHASDNNHVGGAVVRYRTNDKGEVLGVLVLAIAPNDEFRQVLTDPKIKWRFDRAKDAPKGCRLETQDRLGTIVFSLG
jgi:hypothetical protein